MQIGLTSAQSASVVLTGAGSNAANVTVNINRDAAQLGSYTGTYAVPAPILASQLGSITATFYAQSGQAGPVVGTATSTATLIGTNVEFAPITLVGTITQVTANPATFGLASEPVQLTFSTQNGNGEVVAVSPGSGSWTLVDGASVVSVSASGVATPLAVGTAHVRVAVDGIASAVVAIVVEAPPATDAAAFTFGGGKGGNPVEPGFDAVEGNQFQVVGGKDIVVTKLGYEATSATQRPATTAIFSLDGTLIVSASIEPTAASVDGYYYKEIAPTTLTAGQTYYIGSLHGTGAEWTYFHDTATATTPAFILDLGTAAKLSSTIEGGNWSTPGTPRHYVGNFLAHQVP